MKHIQESKLLIVFVGIPFLLYQNAVGCKSMSHKIQKIDAYSEIQAVFDQCNGKDLITFDVDDTLTTANDVLVCANSDEIPFWFKFSLGLRNLGTFYKKETRELAVRRFLGANFQHVERFVFDKDIVRLIGQVQQKSLVVGLTWMGSGAIGGIQSLPEWRVNTLKDVGIEFRPNLPDMSFNKLPEKHHGYPCLYQGILFTNYIDKGLVLAAFLDHYQVKPERIISFDDQLSMLTSIKAVCKQRGISFLGYQVMGAKKLHAAWNTKRALLQFETAMTEERWLHDAEADAILAGRMRVESGSR